MALTISDFPDEILAMIIDIASLQSPRSDLDIVLRSYSFAKELALVCRRFHRLVLPFLYHTIFLGHNPIIKARPQELVLFHKTLRETPTLRPLCRRLYAQIKGPRFADDDYCTVWNDLFTWMTRIHTLEVAVDVMHDEYFGLVRANYVQTGLPWSLIRSVGQRMRELAHFQIQGYFSMLNLRDVVKYAPLTSLEVLQVERAGEIETDSACVEPEDYRTAPFKRLVLYDINASPDTINQLIQWPKELISFSLGRSTIYGADLSMLHSWLSSHRDTLKEIKIGSISVEETGTLFNAADFPNLETIQLPRRAMGSVEENRDRPILKRSPDQADLLLGPKLHTFTWFFLDHNIQRLEWNEFSDQEESWLRRLMKEAVARKSALRKIRIQFYPDMGTAQPQEYPWDRMDGLREEFEPYGLTLEYCDPPVTKSEWQVMFDESFNPFDVSSVSSDTEDGDEMMLSP